MSVRRPAIVGLLCVALLTLAAPALAHTDLAASTPADGATVHRALERIVLEFTEPIDPVGEGAKLLDADGAVVDAEVSVDGAEIRIRPDEALTDGAYGVKWVVRSEDAHPVRGAVRFTVDVPEASAAAGPDDGEASEPPSEPAAATSAPPTAVPTDDASEVAAATDPTDDALANALVDTAQPLELADTALRAVFYAVALGALGVATFLLGAWDGPRREVRLLCRLIDRLAATTVIVVIAQVLVRSALISGTFDGVTSTFGELLAPTYAAGVGLRLAGALLLIAGVPRLRRHLLAARPIAGGAVDVDLRDAAHPDSVPASTGRRLRPGAVMLVGVGAIAVSFGLIGHATTGEPRIVAVTAPVAHTLAAGIWGGGLLGLATVLTHRRRRFISLHASVLAARFSVLATGGILAAAAAGVALAAVRLDAVEELWTTPYGYALLAKVALVGVLATIGAHNHFVIVPTLRRIPDHVVDLRLRWLAVIEVALVVVVVAMTSILVSLAG